jgi:hypothetical protein
VGGAVLHPDCPPWGIHTPVNSTARWLRVAAAAGPYSPRILYRVVLNINIMLRRRGNAGYCVDVRLAIVHT